MKFCRSALLLAGALLLNVTLACAAPVDKPSGPRLEIREPDFDFGQVVEGAMLEHTFKVFNRGDQPLAIQGVSPS